MEMRKRLTLSARFPSTWLHNSRSTHRASGHTDTSGRAARSKGLYTDRQQLQGQDLNFRRAVGGDSELIARSTTDIHRRVR